MRRRLRIAPPPRQPTWFLGWVPVVFKMGDAEYLRLVGLDAYLLFRFTRLCCLISVEFMVLGMFILTPIYLNGNNGMTNLNRITVSNLKANSSALIAPLILSWVYCFHFFWVVGKEMDILAKLRRDFFAQGNYLTNVMLAVLVVVLNLS